MEKPFPRRWRITAVLIAAGILRILLIVQNEVKNPLARIPMVDASLHHEAALEIAEGNLVQDGPFERPPGYAYFLGALYALFGPSVRAAAIAQAVLGVAGLWLLYRLARRYLEESSATLAVLLGALYGPLAFFELKLLPASLSVFLLLVFLNLLTIFLQRTTKRWAFLSGLAAGFLILIRPNLVFIGGLILLWLFIRRAPHRWRSAALFGLGILAGLAPAFLHNLAAGDGSVIVCRGGGLNFYLGNCREARASFTDDFEGVTDPAALPDAARHVFERESGTKPRNAAQVEAFFVRKGIFEILDDPFAWLALEAEKGKALLSEFEYGVNYSYEAEKDILGILYLFLVPFALLAALGIPGMFASSKNQGGLPRTPLVLALAGIALSALVFFTYSRFRLPAAPILALLSADALMRCAAALKHGQGASLVRFLVPCVLIGVVALLPSSEPAARQVSGGHALVGAAYYRVHDRENAIAAYERAIRSDPRSVKARQTLAGISAGMGNFQRAVSLHLKAVDLSPRDPHVLFNASLFFLLAPPPFNDTDQAIELARRAEASGPELLFPDLCLDIAWRQKGSPEESRMAFERVLEKGRRSPRLVKSAADLYRSLGYARRADILEEELLNRKAE